MLKRRLKTHLKVANYYSMNLFDPLSINKYSLLYCEARVKSTMKLNSNPLSFQASLEGIKYWITIMRYWVVGGYTVNFRVHTVTLLPLPMYMLGLEPETCGDRTVRGLPGKYSPVSKHLFIFTLSNKNTSNWNQILFTLV